MSLLLLLLPPLSPLPILPMFVPPKSLLLNCEISDSPESPLSIAAHRVLFPRPRLFFFCGRQAYNAWCYGQSASNFHTFFFDDPRYLFQSSWSLAVHAACQALEEVY
jgi:hypothetical protein